MGSTRRSALVGLATRRSAILEDQAQPQAAPPRPGMSQVHVQDPQSYPNRSLVTPGELRDATVTAAEVWTSTDGGARWDRS